MLYRGIGKLMSYFYIKFRQIKQFYLSFVRYFIAIFFILNMLKKKSAENNLQFDRCCICAGKNCQESIDHAKVQIQQLKVILENAKNPTPKIDKLKQSISSHFSNLRKDLLKMLQTKQKQIICWLNCFYFTHFSEHQVNIPLMSQLLYGDWSRLPQKKLAKTLKYLKKYKQKNQKPSFQIDLDMLSEDVNNFIFDIKINDILSKINNSINTQLLILPKKIDLSLSCNSSKSTSSKISQQAIQAATAQYQWKHIRITKNTKTLQLNNRNITDQDLIVQIPILQTFNNIKQLQIRNNRITVLSCALIANSLKFLQVLDIRGNRVGDEGVIKIINGIPALKGLFVSQTNLGDLSGKQICTGLTQLQTLWCEHNLISAEVCVQISKKAKLRILSLVGNRLDSDARQKIKIIFLAKGYLNI